MRISNENSIGSWHPHSNYASFKKNDEKYFKKKFSDEEVIERKLSSEYNYMIRLRVNEILEQYGERVVRKNQQERSFSLDFYNMISFSEKASEKEFDDFMKILKSIKETKLIKASSSFIKIAGGLATNNYFKKNFGANLENIVLYNDINQGLFVTGNNNVNDLTLLFFTDDDFREANKLGLFEDLNDFVKELNNYSMKLSKSKELIFKPSYLQAAMYYKMIKNVSRKELAKTKLYEKLNRHIDEFLISCKHLADDYFINSVQHEAIIVDKEKANNKSKRWKTIIDYELNHLGFSDEAIPELSKKILNKALDSKEQLGSYPDQFGKCSVRIQ